MAAGFVFYSAAASGRRPCRSAAAGGRRPCRSAAAGGLQAQPAGSRWSRALHGQEGSSPVCEEIPKTESLLLHFSSCRPAEDASLRARPRRSKRAVARIFSQIFSVFPRIGRELFITARCVIWLSRSVICRFCRGAEIIVANFKIMLTNSDGKSIIKAR